MSKVTITGSIARVFDAETTKGRKVYKRIWVNTKSGDYTNTFEITAWGDKAEDYKCFGEGDEVTVEAFVNGNVSPNGDRVFHNLKLSSIANVTGSQENQPPATSQVSQDDGFPF